jgi:hypothetical protein
MQMGGFMLVMLLLFVFFTGHFIYLKKREADARAPQYVEVGLPPIQAAQIGAKASASLIHRMAKGGGRLESMSSRPDLHHAGPDRYEWRVSTRGGEMIFQVALSDGVVRLSSWADEITIAQFGRNLTGMMGLGFAITNALYRAIGLPRDPGSLVRRRKRVFRAVLAAETGHSALTE